MSGAPRECAMVLKALADETRLRILESLLAIGTTEYDESQRVPIKLLSMGSVTASTETVLNGTFPISRPLYIVTRTSPVGLTKSFIDYAQAKAVHDIIKQQYFVPLVD